MSAHSPKTLHLGDAQLAADLLLPAEAVGMVVFAHGSGSRRSSPRNQQVARYFEDRYFAVISRACKNPIMCTRLPLVGALWLALGGVEGAQLRQVQQLYLPATAVD